MSETTIKLIQSGAVVVGLVVVRALVLRAVHRFVEEPGVWFSARRTVTYIATTIGGVTLAWIWLDAFGSLATYFGLLSAGIAIALSDLLKNMAGWVYILARHPFRLSDRISVADISGDVVDIRLFRFSLMEIGDWVDADQSTGRLVHIPNGTVFTNAVANYTEGFEYVWHEIPVLITFESDWEQAKAIVRRNVTAASADVDAEAMQRLRETAREYQIKIGTLTPTVYLTVRDSGVLLTGRVLVAARERRAVEERVWEGILRDFAAQSGIDLAYPTIRAFHPESRRFDAGNGVAGSSPE
jgi:small-conductance mechanosensitive channel